MAAYTGVVTCCICFGGKDAEWAALTCGHVFHDPCIAEWLNHRKPAVCPMCRARSHSVRRLVGIETHLDAADDAAVSSHLRARERELAQAQADCAARQIAADEAAELAAARAAEAVAGQLEAERATRRAERAAERAGAALEGALQQQDLLSAQLADASRREVALRQELAAAHERHATDVYRLRSRHKEAEFALQEARRRVTALQLSSKGITLDQAETLLQGEESPLAQVLVARNAELAAAERRLEAARGEVAAARDQGARDLEAAERRHRAELSKEGEERKKLRQRELVLEYERDSQARRAQELEGQLEELRGVLLALQGTPQVQAGQRQGLPAGPRTPALAAGAAAGAGAAAQARPGAQPGAGARPAGSASVSATAAAAAATAAPEASGGAISRHAAGGRADATAGAAGGMAPAAAAAAAEAGPGGGAQAEVEEGWLADDEPLAASPQPPLISFLQPPGAGARGRADAPSFLRHGKPGSGSAAAPAGSWPARGEGGLVLQGPDGRGGVARHLAPITNAAPRPGAKRPGGGAAPLSGPAAKQHRLGGDQFKGGAGGGAKQLKLSSFFGGGGGSKGAR